MVSFIFGARLSPLPGARYFYWRRFFFLFLDVPGDKYEKYDGSDRSDRSDKDDEYDI